ncbi:MAG: MBL fold metallo-hydrolase [Actinobacteria bacterium]|nr:MAG: MBL fold metallo-hydrolase [Actinomycetota bacterium]
MDIRTIRTEGLGDSTYVLSTDGVGVVVDPQRDIDRFVSEVEEIGAEVRWVVETHLHNDYVSGARHLAKVLDAELVIPAGAAPVYRHRPAFHMEDLTESSLTLRPMHTPGHTPEHMSYVVVIDGNVVAVFSGGSLLVGSAGRSDLLGDDRAETLARLQYGSVRRLASLPNETRLLPTHGAGSFCTSSAAGTHTSTIGAEKRDNPVLQVDDEEDFVSTQLTGLVPFPSYYARMGPANLAGTAPIDLETPLPPISEDAYTELRSGVTVVDARANEEFARGHLPGSLGVALRNDFGVWVGWVTPHNTPLLLVLDEDQSLEEARRQLGRIGYDRIVGYVSDLGSWTDTELIGYPTHDVTSFEQGLAAGSQVLDSRAPNEWAEGTIPGSVRAYSPDLTTGIPDDLDRTDPVLVACATGYRATIAASLLEKAGYQPEVLVGAGVSDVLARRT